MEEDFLLFVDVETSGFCWLRNDIVSMCMIKTDLELNIIDKFYETVKVPFNKFYSDDAETVHGFSKNKIKTFQEPEIFLKKVLDFLGKNFFKFISHTPNNFDWKMVLGMFLKNGSQFDFYQRIASSESTIKMGRKLGYKVNKLDTWAERIGFKLKHHDAESDTLCCLEVYKYLTAELG